MNRQQYIQLAMPELPQGIRNFTKTMEHLSNFERDIGKTIEQGFTRDEYIAYFSRTCGRSSTFVTRKSIIKAYVTYLVNLGELPKEHEQILTKLKFEDLEFAGSVKSAESSGARIAYFKNLSSMQNSINKTLEETECFDKSKYDTATAILYLAWFGVTRKEIVDIKKNDLRAGGVFVGDRFIKLPNEIFSFLSLYAGSDGYYQQAKGVILRKYVESEYLIRTDRCAHLDEGKILANLSRMNAVTKKKYSLTYDTAYDSGLFFRAYMRECEEEDFNIISMADHDLTEDQKMHLAKNYAAYKKLFA